MKVTLLTMKDFAGSGTRIVEGLQLLGIDAEIVALNPSNYGLGVISVKNIAEIKKRIEDSDIIHWKGDDVPTTTFFSKIEIPNMPYVFMAGGTRFRRGDFASTPIAPLNYYTGAFKGAVTPELCYGDIRWTPHTWNDFEYCFKRKDKFQILHIPSKKSVKGSDIIAEAIELLKQRRNDFQYKTYTNIKNKQVLELKKNCHIYIDQCILPHYALAGVEAMAFGIPIFANVKNYPVKTPVINLGRKKVTPENIADALDKAMDWDKLKQRSIATFEYCKQIHGRGAEMWLNIYKQVLAEKGIYILIPTYKQSKYVIECLKSFEQEDCKVILGIDGCKETAELLKNYKQKNLRIIQFKKNRGCYKTLNDLLKHVPYGSNYIYFGSDDVWYSGGIEELKKYTREDIVQFYYENFIGNKKQGKSKSSSSRMYSRRIVDRYEEVRVGGDTALMKKLLKVKITHINKSFFKRRLHKDSLTNCKNYGRNSEYRKSVWDKINCGFTNVE